MASEDFNKVWKISDYGNVNSLAAKSTVVSDGPSLFETGLPTGVSTKTVNGKTTPVTAVQSAAQGILNDPTAYVAGKAAAETQDPSLLDRGKSLLSNIFDTEDEADLKIGPVPLGGVESVWDGMLRAFNWGYDRLGRLEAAAISAAPGGIQTLTWDETETVSPGQAFVGSMGVSAGKLKRGEGNVGDIFAAGPLGILGSMLSPDSELQKKDYDITTPEGQAAFDSGPEKFFSGLSDAAISIFADPLIVAGKATKMARLKYVDRSVKDNNAAMLDELAAGRELSAAGNTKDMAPIARIVHDAVTPDASGARTSERELALRDELVYSGAAYDIASALRAVRDGDYITGELIIRAGLEDPEAFAALAKRNATAAEALSTAKRTNLELQIAQDPSRYATVLYRYTTRSEKAFDILEDAKKSGNTALAAKAQQEFDDSLEDLLAIERGVSVNPLARPTQEAMAMSNALVKEASEESEIFARALNDSIRGAFAQSDRGFASDTILGKAVSARRAKRARAKYERKSTAGQGWTSEDFFGASRFRRTIRLFTRINDETPSYYIANNGAGAVDQGREMGAFLDTLAMFGGSGKEIINPKTGQVQIVGGIERKNELFSRYAASLARNDDTSLAVLQIQDDIKKELIRYYGISDQAVDHLVTTAFGEQKKMVDSINQTVHGQFYMKDDAVLAVAPFLKSQLSQGTYLLPWDYLERVFINVEKGKIKDPLAGSILTPGQWTANKALSANKIFQDFWRPAVLFRLGYPQRNVAEGVFRSMAFNESFAPLAWAAQGALYGASNFRRAQKATKQIQKAEQALKTTSVDRNAFDNLVSTQNALFEGQRVLNRAKSVMEDSEKNYARDTTLIAPEFLLSPAGFTTADGKFQVARFQQVVKGKATFVKEDGKYVSDSGTIEKIGSKWVATDPSGQAVGSFKTLTAAREAFDQADQVVTRWRINEMSPTPGQYIPGRKTFDNAEDAQAALTGAVERAFNTGKADPRNPQLVEIARAADEARGRTVKEFTDKSTGKVYKTTAEIDAELLDIQKKIDNIEIDIDNFGGRPIPKALETTKFQGWRSRQMAEIEGQVKADQEYLDEMLPLLGPDITPVEQAHVDFLKSVMAQKKNTYKAIERDDSFALSEFANQATAKKYVDNGSRVLVGGVVLNSAFSNPRYRDIAHTNMSSDNTVKATLSARLQLSESLLYRKRIQDYVDVDPSMGDKYWQGMESMLRQYAQDGMGKMIVRGMPDDEIALWLLRDPEGMKVSKSLDEAWTISQGADVPPRIGDDLDNALAFVQSVREGLERITAGDTAVWKIMETRPPRAAELKSILSGNPALSQVVGYKDEVQGFKSLMDTYRTLTQKAFRFIGTMPEDSLVRAPFYSARYTATRDELLAILLSRYSKETDIPIEYLNSIEVQAHRRALKDTKDWLYTIDRRTNLGKYGEIITPFISATQNSVTTVGRLIRRDPALPGMMLLLWQAPTKVGWEDKEGTLIIPLPQDLIPDGVADFFGLSGMRNMTINKSSLNVIFPESGFAFVPRPAPLAQVAASELMKKGLLISVEAPNVLVNFLGKEQADSLWNGVKKYTFGEESSISTEFFSYDKVTPPVFNKLVQYMQKDGSKQYGYQYGLQARTQELLWMAGKREKPATAQEIMERTNGMFLLRMLGNVFAFTPPNYESPIGPLMDIQKTYDQVYGLDGPMKFSQTFGNEFLTIADTATTENVGGTTITTDTVRNIKKYNSLIREITPTLGEDLDVLGIIVNGDPKTSAYDVNAYQWLTNENIPGTSRTWREVNSGAESMAETQRQAGWVEYIKFKGQLDAVLQQRGLSSYRVKGAQDLNEYRKEFINGMMNNPLYAGWAVDYQSTGSSKTYSAVNLLKQALNNDEFMADKGDSKTWQTAAEYIDVRERLIQLVKESGVSLENDANAGLKAEWDKFRQDKINGDVGWAGIANRYLNGDDTPVDIGTTFNDIGAGND